MIFKIGVNQQSHKFYVIIWEGVIIIQTVIDEGKLKQVFKEAIIEMLEERKNLSRDVRETVYGEPFDDGWPEPDDEPFMDEVYPE
jgi:hypothetical protein